MASIVSNLAPPTGLKAALMPWMKIDWSPEIEHDIYRDWGWYYSHRRRENLAMYYYKKALAMLPDDYVTLYRLSQTKRKNAQTTGAIQDCLKAKGILKSLQKKYSPINLEICDALYELNKLEIAKAELHDNTRLFRGNKIKAFEKRLVVLDENIKNCCGDELTQFLSVNEKLVVQVKKSDIKARNEVQDKPLWKILKEQGKCDVLSILDIEDELLSPLEIARRGRAFNVFNQMYIDKSWIDVLFLKRLRKNPVLLLDQCKKSQQFLGQLSKNKYEELKNFLKMLHARAPMYYIRYNKFTNKKMMDRFREHYLYNVQYQTGRDMRKVLKNIKSLRAAGDIAKLSRYVEDSMGDYVMLKTNRVMPWKFEFINEVYNTLALAFAEQCKVTTKRFGSYDSSALLKLLQLPTEKTFDVPDFVFGDRSTYQESEETDPNLSKSRQLIARLEKRMKFAKYSIEKCYLYHMIGYTHLKSNRHDECCFAARKGIKETKNCNSVLWLFLCTLLIVKSTAAQHKLEQTREALLMANAIKEQLHSPQISRFVTTCMFLNEEEFHIKLTRSVHSSRSTRASTASSQLTVRSDSEPSSKQSSGERLLKEQQLNTEM